MSSTDKFSIRDMQERKRRMGDLPPLPGTPAARAAPPAAPVGMGTAPAPRADPVAPPAPEEVEDRLDLVAYWESIVRQRKWIALAVVVGTVLGTWFAYTQPIVYRAQGSFSLNRGSPDLYLIDKEEAWWVGDSFLKDAREIESRSVLQRAAEILPSELDAIDREPTGEDRAAAESSEWRQIQAALRVTPLEKERLVTVEATAATPAMAAAIVNAAMNAYVEEDRLSYRLRASEMYEKLGRAITAKRDEIAKIEARIVEEEARLGQLGGVSDPLNSEEQSRLRILEAYIMERSRIEFELQGLETQIAGWEVAIEREAREEIPADVKRIQDAFDQRIRELHIERARLLVRYTEDNPKIHAIDDELRSVEEIRKTEVKLALARGSHEDSERIQRLREQLLMAEMRRGDLGKKLESYTQVIAERARAMQAAANARLPIASLRSQQRGLEEVVNDFEKRRSQATFERDGGESKVQILEKAIPPLGAVQSGRSRPLLLWVAGSLVLGVGIAIFLDSLSRTVKGPAAVRKELGLRTIGLLPVLSNVERDRYIDPTRPTSLLAEAFGVLRNNIRFGQTGNYEKLLLVTSPLPGEGKSFTSANLALSFTLEGNRVVLIDGDLRRARPEGFFEALGVDPAKGRVGLAQYLTHPDIRFSDVVVPTGAPDLHWIPSGERPANPAQALRSPKLAEVFTHAQRYFDVAIVDSPALLPVADSAQIAAHVQGVIVVLSNEETAINAAVQATERLRHVGSRIVGVVLNRTQRYVSGHYYGYSRYGYHYGDEQA